MKKQILNKKEMFKIICKMIEQYNKLFKGNFKLDYYNKFERDK